MNKPKLFGRYYLIDKIAAGGMAEIYLAKTVSIDGFEKPLAIKMIHPKFAKDKIFVKKFTNEAKTIVKLSHGNIVPVFDMGIEAGKYYIAMEYIKGKNIKEVLRRCAEKGEELTLEFVIFIIIEVCKGLAYAHRKVDDDGTPLNIIHKDISPQNILISYEGDVKLVDFGIAQVADKGEEEIDESIEGKIRYMSPEQITGKPLDARSDNYSVGLLLYEMIAIDKFFNQNNVSELVRAVKEADNEEKVYNNQFLPDQIKPIIVKAINKNIDERYQQIEGLQLALTHYLYSIPSLITSYDISNFMNFLFEKEIHEEIELLKKTSLIDSSMKKITQILKKPDTRNLDYSLFSKEEISNIEDTFTSSVKKPEKTESPQDEELEYIQYGRIVPKGTIIFEQGEEGHHFYIIKEGKVRIYRQIGMLKNTLAVFGEGDFFGEMSLLNDEPRSATAEAEEDCQLLYIDRESFYQIIKNHIDIAVKIIHRLSIRLKDTNQIISSILIKDDFNKLVKSILSFGDEKDNTLKTTLKVLLEKIWNMDKTSLIKYLKKLKETDLINIQGDDLIVSDTNRLKALFNDIKINRHE